MGKFPDTIFEEREEMMVSPDGDSTPTLRTAHFLKPTITINAVHDQQNVAPFCVSSQPSSSNTSYNIKKVHKKVNLDNTAWKSWFERLRSKHEWTWQKAGIYDALLSSTYSITRDDDDCLILAFAEKWCPDTNTFVFPWGEATISLEDMIVLGGFSVLGEFAIDLFDAQKNAILKECLTRMPKNLDQNELLLQMCKENEFEFEHESFLVLWLSRFVFPCDSIRECVYPIADCLARGIKVALAPAVLASIYRDLSLLKAQIIASAELNLHGLTARAPFQLVRVWIWERFIELRPKPNVIQFGEPRYAKWHQLKTLKTIDDDDLRRVLNSDGNSFQWRPYSSGGLHVYTNRERSVLVDTNLDEEIHSFVRCIRVSQLVGLDGIEQYLPHRTAMQFGIDQDLPGHVARLNETVVVAWANYNRPIDDLQLYIPAQLFEADVTTRYLEWWKYLMFDRQDVVQGVFRKKRSLRRSMSVKSKSKSSEDGIKVAADNKGSTERNDKSQDWPCILDPFEDYEDIPPPPGFPLKYKKQVEAQKSGDNNDVIVQNEMQDEASRMVLHVQDEAVAKESEGEVVDGSPSNKGAKYDCISDVEILEFEFECRIKKLEKVFGVLKSKKLSRQIEQENMIGRN